MLQGEESLVVHTSNGKVKGERQMSDLGKQVDTWDSIPYAEPPLGNLRYIIDLIKERGRF